MKKICLFLIAMVVCFPLMVNAKMSMDFTEAYENIDNYINTFPNQKYLFIKDSGSKFITEEEYKIIGGSSSYLSDGQSYWSITKNDVGYFAISKNSSYVEADEEIGVRATKYIKTDTGNVEVKGEGTYNNPWVVEIETNTNAPVVGVNSVIKNQDHVYTIKFNITSTNGLNPQNDYSYYISDSKNSPVGGSWIKYSGNGFSFNFGNEARFSNKTGDYYIFVKRVADNYDNLSNNNNLNNNLGYHVFGPYYLDYLKPTCSITSSNTTTQAQSVSIRATASDTNKNNSVVKHNWKDNTSLLDVTRVITANGNYTLSISDSAGNTNECSINITNIDRVKPTCSIESSGSAYGPTVTITKVGTDIYAAAPYSWDASSYSTSNSKTISSTQTVTGYIKDQAGNVGVCSKSVSVSTQSSGDSGGGGYTNVYYNERCCDCSSQINAANNTSQPGTYTFIDGRGRTTVITRP